MAPGVDLRRPGRRGDLDAAHGARAARCWACWPGRPSSLALGWNPRPRPQPGPDGVTRSAIGWLVCRHLRRHGACLLLVMKQISRLGKLRDTHTDPERPPTSVTGVRRPSATRRKAASAHPDRLPPATSGRQQKRQRQ